MEVSHFHYGDVIINKEDNSRWRFIRYLIDKVTRVATNAPSVASKGSRTRLYAVPLDGSENAKEQELLASLFIKEPAN